MSLDDRISLGRGDNAAGYKGGLILGFRVDIPLFMALLVLSGLSLIVLYSAGNQDFGLLLRQVLRLIVAFAVMVAIAQIQPHHIKNWSPWLFGVGTLLLIAVLVAGDVGKGAQRWLNFGLFRFQPSEMMKIAVPMMVAWYLSNQPIPPRLWRTLIATGLITLPTLLIMKQPDLGTSLLIGASGVFVLLLAGIRWRWVLLVIGAAVAAAPVLWNMMHAYQKRRVMTFLNPENDPLGAGYHIIQSKIAIGSGGVYGKGWLNGSQAQLDFLPERTTDFIFAVFAEEFGFIGITILILLYLFIIGRGLNIAMNAQDSFSRLICGALTLIFFFYVFVNIGMVSGLLPVVGLPLPMISYGGTSIVTLMAAFGIMMSIQTHRKLLPT